MQRICFASLRKPLMLTLGCYPMNPICESCGHEMTQVAWNKENYGDIVVDIPCDWECQNESCESLTQPNNRMNLTASRMGAQDSETS